jgi:hypothetical protein
MVCVHGGAEDIAQAIHVVAGERAADRVARVKKLATLICGSDGVPCTLMSDP